MIINNGVYGERMSRMAASYGMNTVELKFPWQERPDLLRVEQALSREPAIQVVAMVHHETTTGMISPVGEISDLANRYGKHLVVDAVSGLGGEALDLSRHRIDICIGSAGKCIQGYPGLSFVLIRREEMSRIQKIAPRSLYLSLSGNFKDQEKGTVPFTPAVQLYYAFDEALSELLDEGIDGRIARYQAASRLLRKGFSKLGLKFLLPEELRSNTITSVYLPEGKSYPELHDRLKERGFVIYAGQGVLQADIFRVANMGMIKKSDFKRFLVNLGEILQ
jgi:2-aminoethylphosphonate-pyruvate transaminase